MVYRLQQSDYVCVTQLQPAGTLSQHTPQASGNSLMLPFLPSIVRQAICI